MLVPPHGVRHYRVPVAVVFCLYDHPVLTPIVPEDFHLHLGVGVDSDVENLAMAREPRVGPPTVVGDPDWCDTVDDRRGLLPC